jgi:hypothetical protein
MGGRNKYRIAKNKRSVGGRRALDRRVFPVHPYRERWQDRWFRATGVMPPDNKTTACVIADAAGAKRPKSVSRKLVLRPVFLEKTPGFGIPASALSESMM